MLTPMDIHNKEFSKSFRGFNENEVNDFLNEIIEDYGKIYKENTDLKDRISMLNDKLQNYAGLENTLNNTLIVAQKTADEISANARQKAEMILQEAEIKADKIVDDARSKVGDINNEYQNIKKQVLEFKMKYKSLLEAELNVLNELAGSNAKENNGKDDYKGENTGTDA